MRSKLVNVELKKIDANPYRNIDQYPMDAEDIARIQDSIKVTGYWENINARPGKTKGRYQIAAGHHRLEALKRLNTGTTKIGLLVADYSNEEMLQMMHRENEAKTDTCAYTEAHDVQAVIEAYGRGEIELPEVPEKTNAKHIRYADPDKDQHPYTEVMIAEFLGMTKKRGDSIACNHACKVAFNMLDAIKEKIVTREQLKGLKREQAQTIANEAMAIRNTQKTVANTMAGYAKQLEEMAEQEPNARKRTAKRKDVARYRSMAEKQKAEAAKTATDWAKNIANETKKGNLSIRDIREEAAEKKADIRSALPAPLEKARTATQHIEKYRNTVSHMLNDEMFETIHELLKGDYGVSHDDVVQLMAEVEALWERAEAFYEHLEKYSVAQVLPGE